MVKAHPPFGEGFLVPTQKEMRVQPEGKRLQRSIMKTTSKSVPLDIYRSVGRALVNGGASRGQRQHEKSIKVWKEYQELDLMMHNTREFLQYTVV